MVTKGLIVNQDTKKPLLIQVSLTVDDVDSLVPGQLQWHNAGPDGEVSDKDETIATAELPFGKATQWLSSWTSVTHLVLGRIQALQDLAEQGIANKFSNTMAYRLFANSLVDYAPKYRGMQSVVLHDLEAFADVQLCTERAGNWTIPPHWIDNVCHLAGFIMNVSNAVDNQAKFCVAPGCGSLRFAKDLVASGRYRSYVKMIATKEDPNVFLGDVYVLQDEEIIGMVEAIKFRAYPRMLMQRFFSPRDVAASSSVAKPIGDPAKVVAAPRIRADASSTQPPSVVSKPGGALPSQTGGPGPGP